MTIDKVREIALLLPGAEERDGGFFVEDACFARVADGQLHHRDASGWTTVALTGGDIDWTMVEDRVARSWELAAPDAMLEAGGR